MPTVARLCQVKAKSSEFHQGLPYEWQGPNYLSSCLPAFRMHIWGSWVLRPRYSAVDVGIWSSIFTLKHLPQSVSLCSCWSFFRLHVPIRGIPNMHGQSPDSVAGYLHVVGGWLIGWCGWIAQDSCGVLVSSQYQWKKDNHRTFSFLIKAKMCFHSWRALGLTSDKGGEWTPATAGDLSWNPSSL